MSSSQIARLFLGLNAGFSLIIGIDLLLATEMAVEMLFAVPAEWQGLTLRVLGIGLLIFAADLCLMALDRFVSKGAVLLISVLDLGWIAGSAVLFLFFAPIFTDLGLIILAVVAIVVGICALGQYLGARGIVPPKSQAEVRSVGDVLQARVTRAVAAPTETVWAVMTDHPAYADVASNISKVELLSGDGIGMERRCYGPKGENWRETCDLFDPGRAYGFRIHTDAPDYPYPIAELQGRWSVVPKGTGSEFSIHIDAKPKGNFLMRSLFKMAAKRKFKPILIDLADGWSARMEKEAAR